MDTVKCEMHVPSIFHLLNLKYVHASCVCLVKILLLFFLPMASCDRTNFITTIIKIVIKIQQVFHAIIQWNMLS